MFFFFGVISSQKRNAEVSFMFILDVVCCLVVSNFRLIVTIRGFYGVLWNLRKIRVVPEIATGTSCTLKFLGKKKKNRKKSDHLYEFITPRSRSRCIVSVVRL